MPFKIFHTKSKKLKTKSKSSLDLFEQKVAEPPDLQPEVAMKLDDERGTSILKDSSLQLPNNCNQRRRVSIGHVSFFGNDENASQPQITIPEPNQPNQRRRVSIGHVSFFGDDGNPSQPIPADLPAGLKKHVKKKSKSTFHLNFLGKGHDHVTFQSDFVEPTQSKLKAGKEDKKKRRSSIHTFMSIGSSIKKLSNSRSGSLHKLDDEELKEGNDSGITHDDDQHHDKHESDNHLDHHHHSQNHHHHRKHHREHRKSFSCGANLDQMADTREQRISDIVQLDNYIDYLKRSADMDHLSNRLCCAQLLKLFFLRHEKKFVHDTLRSRCLRNGVDLFRLGLAKSPGGAPDSDSGLGVAEDNNSDQTDTANENDEDDTSNGMGANSDDEDDDEDADDNHEGDEDSANGSDDSSVCPNGRKSPRSRGRKMSVFPHDIEIY